MGLLHDITSPSQCRADFVQVCATLRGTRYYEVFPSENIIEQYENDSQGIITWDSDVVNIKDRLLDSMFQIDRTH